MSKNATLTPIILSGLSVLSGLRLSYRNFSKDAKNAKNGKNVVEETRVLRREVTDG